MKKYLILILIACLASLSEVVVAQKKEARAVGTFTKIAFRVPGKLYLRQGSPQKVELQGDADILKSIETKVEGNKLVIGSESKWNWNDNDDEITVYVTVKDIQALNVGGSGSLIAETKITASDLALSVSGSGSLTAEVAASGDLSADVSGSGDMEVKGKAEHLNSNVSGSGKVNLNSIAISDKANFKVSGSGKIEAKGNAAEVYTSISGSGKVLAADLETNRCEVHISGSGDVEINVKNELDANISGSGTVSYKGNPSKVNSKASGSGKVSKM